MRRFLIGVVDFDLVLFFFFLFAVREGGDDSGEPFRSFASCDVVENSSLENRPGRSFGPTVGFMLVSIILLLLSSMVMV